MIILRNQPASHRSVFHPSFLRTSPSVAYWMIQPEVTEEHNQAVGEGHQKNPTAAANEEPKKENKKGEAEPASTRASSPTLPFSWLALTNSDFEVAQDDDGDFLLTTDLPGVKHADLNVEFRDSALHIQAARHTRTGPIQRFARRFPMDEDVIDIPNLSATLEDGILTVKVPLLKTKSEEEAGAKEDASNNKRRSYELTVSTQAPPEEMDGVELNLEVDVPGIKASDLQIALDTKTGLIQVVGERKARGGNQSSKVTEAYRLNTHKVDVSQVAAFLADGVLTLRAPPKSHPFKIVAVNGHLPAPKKTTTTTTTKTAEETKTSNEQPHKMEEEHAAE